MNEETTIEIPKTKAPDVIDVESLDNPTPEVEVASGANLPTSDEILANVSSRQESLQRDIDLLGEEDTENTLVSLLRQQATEDQVRQQAEEQAGLGDLRNQLQSLSAQVAAESKFLNADLLATEREASQQGAKVTRGFVARKMSNRQRESAIRTNTLLGRAAILQGNIEAAEASVNRAVESAFAPIRAEIEIQKFNLDRLDKQRDRLSKEQEKLLDRQISLVEKREDTFRDERKVVNDLAKELLTVGAPQSVIDEVMQSASPEEALAVNSISKYLGQESKLRNTLLSMQIRKEQQQFEQAQVIAEQERAFAKEGVTPVSREKAATLNKELLNSDHYNSMLSLDKTLDSLTSLKNQLDKAEKVPGALNFINKSAVNSLYNTALVNTKEYFNLGVLNGPDLDILKEIVPDPTVGVVGSSVDLPLSVVGGSPRAIRKKQFDTGYQNLINQVEQGLDNRFVSIYSSYDTFGSEQIPGLRKATEQYLRLKENINPELGDSISKLKNDGYSAEEIATIINPTLAK